MHDGPKRDRERKNLHEPHGWHRSTRAHIPQTGKVFIDCPCGWFGWVSDDVAPSTHAETTS